MASSQAAVPAPAALPQPSYAGLGRRMAAFFVDLPIAYAPVLLVGIVFRIAHALRFWIPASEGLTPDATWRAMGISAKLAIIVAFLVSMGSFYLTLFESSPWQASFGKRLLGIYVTDDEGRRISVGRVFGRWFAKLFLNYFWLWPIKHDNNSGERAEKSAARFRRKDARSQWSAFARRNARSMAGVCGVRNSFRVAPRDISLDTVGAHVGLGGFSWRQRSGLRKFAKILRTQRGHYPTRASPYLGRVNRERQY